MNCKGKITHNFNPSKIMSNGKVNIETTDFQIGDVVVLKSDPMESAYKKVIEDILDDVAYCVFSNKKGELQRKPINFAALMLWVEPEGAKENEEIYFLD